MQWRPGHPGTPSRLGPPSVCWGQGHKQGRDRLLNGPFRVDHRPQRGRPEDLVHRVDVTLEEGSGYTTTPCSLHQKRTRRFVSNVLPCAHLFGKEHPEERRAHHRDGPRIAGLAAGIQHSIPQTHGVRPRAGPRTSLMSCGGSAKARLAGFDGPDAGRPKTTPAAAQDGAEVRWFLALSAITRSMRVKNSAARVRKAVRVVPFSSARISAARRERSSTAACTHS